jgi:sugar phosphate isomerase/epimerase
MPDLKPLEPGVMFWAGRDEFATVLSLGVRCGQMGIDGDFAWGDQTPGEWKAALAQHDFTLLTVFGAYTGESYADIPTVRRTVGFVPPGTRAERERRTCEISDFAAKLGVASIACHIGFVEDGDTKVRDVVRRICDHAARHGQTFALETGQESAQELLRFMDAVDRPNLRINFDPANMILYGSGDPIEAFRLLAARVISVHAKDGDWPPKDVPEALGKEKPLGQGSVGIGRWIAALREQGFRGQLNVEREAENQEQRLAEIRGAIELIRKLTA